MVKDALKFFHAYINEMIELGGENLPRAVSTKLGAKLAKLYQKKGINELDQALKTAYRALGAKTSIKKENDVTYNVIVKHSNHFCPIGGRKNPKQANLIQNNLCIPYTKSFLLNLFPDYYFDATIKQCILTNSNSHCNYTLILKSKNSIQKE